MFVVTGLDDSNLTAHNTSVGVFNETPLKEDFSNDFNKLKVRLFYIFISTALI